MTLHCIPTPRQLQVSHFTDHCNDHNSRHDTARHLQAQYFFLPHIKHLTCRLWYLRCLVASYVKEKQFEVTYNGKLPMPAFLDTTRLGNLQEISKILSHTLDWRVLGLSMDYHLYYFGTRRVVKQASQTSFEHNRFFKHRLINRAETYSVHIREMLGKDKFSGTGTKF